MRIAFIHNLPIFMVSGLLNSLMVLAQAPTGQLPAKQTGNQLSRPTVVNVGPVNPRPALSDRSFYAHDLGHRCLDFGAQASWAISSPVIIYSCNGSAAQQIRVKEIDISHDVSLLVQSLFCIGAKGGKVAPGQPLELQQCNPDSPAQRFALDGDSILMGAQASGAVSREFTIEPQSRYSVSRTPLVISTRELSEAEYFRFEAVDKSSARPTSGFIGISSEAALDSALTLGWGTVIEVDPSAPLELKGPFPKRIHAGVTLRGYRKYIDQGPEVHTCTATQDPMFMITEDNVRVTGMRLRGPAQDPRCASSALQETQAIRIDPMALPQPPVATSTGTTAARINPCTVTTFPGCGPEMPRVVIDRLDIGYFTGSAVDTRGTDGSQSQQCPASPLPFPRADRVRVIGNFIHHNGAYGSVTGNGAFVLNKGNIFYRQHAHAIASDPWGSTGYSAYDNFILSEERDTHDVDMHGSLDPGHWQGGLSGDYYDVGWNTLLHTGHFNIDQRGTPCRFTAIHDNVFVQSKDAAIVSASVTPAKTAIYGNVYSAKPSPVTYLAVGDLDGDGIDDVFVGTGGAWYYSSGGQAEWRYLNRMPEQANQLLFGDLDGDGRTDVIALHGSNIDVSWGGISPWQTINVTAWTLSDLAVGDFDGDGKADLFLATGKEWFYAPGGKNWALLDTSSYHTAELRFGDFTHSGRTEVIRASNHRWLVAGLGKHWTDIGPAPVLSVAGLVVGDFDANGFTDLARTNPISHVWEYTTPGKSSSWTPLRSDPSQITQYPIGRFDPTRRSGVLFWSSLHFSYAAGGKNPLLPLSRQDMR